MNHEQSDEGDSGICLPAKASTVEAADAAQLAAFRALAIRIATDQSAEKFEAALTILLRTPPKDPPKEPKSISGSRG